MLIVPRNCSAQKFEGGSIKHDVAVPVSKVPQFIAETSLALDGFMPDTRLVCFGRFDLSVPTHLIGYGTRISPHFTL